MMRWNKTTKSFSKAFKGINEFLDIKEIYDNGIELKDGTIVKGLKVSPIDIWTISNNNAINVISSLRYVFTKCQFPIYQAFVYTPNSFEVLGNSLRKEYSTATDRQKNIISDDLNKLEYFSLNNKKVEFFLFVKGTAKNAAKQHQQLKSEMSRTFLVSDLSFIDYINYLNWLFGVDNNILTRGYFKGHKLITDMSNEDLETELQEININIAEENEPFKNNLERYPIFSINQNKTYFQINDRYYSVLIIKKLPNKFDVGILNFIGRNKDVKTFFITKDSELDLIKMVKKESMDLSTKHKKAFYSHDKVTQENLESKIRSLNTFANEMVQNGDRTLDLSLCLILTNDSLTELSHRKETFTQELRHLGMSVLCPKLLQLALFKYFNPIFSKDKLLTNNLEFNIGFPISTTSFALGYPYHYSTNDDENGFLYGYELQMNGRILLNPWLYKEDEKKAELENRLTGNIILLGDAGSGKTTDMFLFIRYFIRRNNFILWVDPENKNKRGTIANGGTYLDFGSKEHMFNVFQLTCVTTDSNIDEDKQELIDREALRREMWDIELAVVNAIDRFKNVLILYNKHISDNTLSIVGMIADYMYSKFGFFDYEYEDENGETKTIKAKYSTFEGLKNTDYPILSDFADCLLEMRARDKEVGNTIYEEAYTDLLIKITPMLAEHRFYFNGHTTVDIELKAGNILGIGTKRLYMLPNSVANALQYIIYEQAFNYCLSDKVDSVFAYDEAHVTLNNDYILNLLNQLNRRSRKYYNISLLGTQEPIDFADNKEAILNQTTYIIVKSLSKENSRAKLKEMIGIDDRDINRIATFKRGDSYFMCGNKSFFMHTLLTDKERADKGNNYG